MQIQWTEDLKEIEEGRRIDRKSIENNKVESLRMCRKFSESEEAFIKNNFNKIKVSDIANKLNRKEGTIYNKIVRMGLRQSG